MGRRRARDGKNYKEMRKIVEKDGWVAVRQTGDHLHFKHPLRKGWSPYHRVICLRT